MNQRTTRKDVRAFLRRLFLCFDAIISLPGREYPIHSFVEEMRAMENMFSGCNNLSGAEYPLHSLLEEMRAVKNIFLACNWVKSEDEFFLKAIEALSLMTYEDIESTQYPSLKEAQEEIEKFRKFKDEDASSLGSRLLLHFSRKYKMSCIEVFDYLVLVEKLQTREIVL